MQRRFRRYKANPRQQAEAEEDLCQWGGYNIERQECVLFVCLFLLLLVVCEWTRKWKGGKSKKGNDNAVSKTALDELRSSACPASKWWWLQWERKPNVTDCVNGVPSSLSCGCQSRSQATIDFSTAHLEVATRVGDAIAPFVSGECGSFFFAQLLSSATNKCQTNTRRVGQIPFPCYLCICAPQGFARVVPPLACHSMLISVYNEDSRFFGCHGVSLQTLTTLGSISKEGLKADDQFPPTDQHQCCVINTMSPPNTTSLRPTKKKRTVRECQTFLCVGLFRHTNPSCVSFLFAKTCGSAPLSVYDFLGNRVQTWQRWSVWLSLSLFLVRPAVASHMWTKP